MVLRWVKSIVKGLTGKAPTQRTISLERATLEADELSQRSSTDAIEAANTFASQVRHGLEEVAARLDGLADATIPNPNIPLQHKQILDGNRKAYLDKVRRFLDHSSVLKVEPGGIEDFKAHLREALEQLGQQNQKPVTVLNEFLANETRQVQSGLHDLALLAAPGEEPGQRGRRARELAAKAQEILSALAGLAKEQDHLEKRRSTLTREKHSILGELSGIEASDAYTDYQRLLSRKETIQNMLSFEQQKMQTEFSPIASILKRAPSLLDGGMQQYLDNAAKALEQDEKLAIMGVIAAAAKHVETTDLKPARRRRAQQAIAQVTLEGLQEQQQRLRKLRKDYEQVEENISANGVVAKQQELQESLKKVEHQIAQVKEAIAGITKKQLDDELQATLKELGELLSGYDTVKIVLT
ncbi:hypothetical protein AUJ68_02630 [Candidatus Woesearchaeota archaeon CG1_02_57_44]|nr:MAG: hypothetical protein AUJ68_02630 [Candidatus Woesearchaeota archaeon CG1_02_57_44]